MADPEDRQATVLLGPMWGIVRILHAINQISGRAGAEVSLRDIVTRSADEFQQAVVVLSSTNNVVAPFADAGVPCYVPGEPLGGRRSHVQHVRAAIRDFQPDLVHTSLFDADVAGRIAAALERVPAVTSVVNTPYTPEAKAAEPVGDVKLHAARSVDRFLTKHLTSGSTPSARRRRRTPSSTATSPRTPSASCLAAGAAPSSASGRRNGATVPAQLGWGTRSVVINVARQEPQKGQRVLLDALPTVLADRPDTLLVMVGRRGRSSLDLDTRIDRLRLAASAEQLGVRTDVASLLSAADVFAFPSLFEGLGGAAVEALGLGVPLVVSDIPSLREVVGPDRGWLVPVGDPAALASAIVEALRGGEEVEQRCRAARAAFDEAYELDRCVRGMVDLYRDIDAQLPSLRGASPLRWRPRLRLATGGNDGLGG
jgi:glycosyltransferase involved in cell wall biosynthesis